MLHLITTVSDKFIEFVKDDPVRPEISKEFRVDKNRFIAALVEDERPLSMVCVSLHDFVPVSVEELSRTVNTPTTAVFSVWLSDSATGRPQSCGRI